MQRGVEEAEENAKRKNENLKKGIKSGTSTFAQKKKATTKKKATPKKPELNVEKISEMAEKLHLELSDDDISKFTSDDDA